MPYLLPLANDCPSVLSKSSLIVDAMVPEFALKATKARLLTLGDLSKALKKDDNNGLELSAEEKVLSLIGSLSMDYLVIVVGNPRRRIKTKKNSPRPIH